MRATPVAETPSSMAVPVTVIDESNVTVLLAGALIATVGACVSGGGTGLRVTVIVAVATLPALSVARAVMVLAPMASAMLAAVQVPATTSRVAVMPLTVMLAMPVAFAPGS